MCIFSFIFHNQDLKSDVIQVADFLGNTLPDHVIETIVELCTFQSMKRNPHCNPDSLGFNDETDNNENIVENSFLRKGKRGYAEKFCVTSTLECKRNDIRLIRITCNGVPGQKKRSLNFRRSSSTFSLH